MDVKDIKATLDSLEKNIDSKTREVVGEEIKNLSAKFADLEAGIKAGAAGIDEVKSAFEVEVKSLKDFIGKLDAKMSEKKNADKANVDTIKSAIVENGAEIVKVKKGTAVQVKAVGDMTLGVNLSGDQPRDYAAQVASIPGQMVNVSDLIQSITISGGTYTFPREGAGEGAVGAATEGSTKSQRDYDYTMVDVNTDFIAGFTVYSKKMANNLPFLESHLPGALRRDYWIAENSAFNTVMAAGVTASTELAASHDTKAEQLIAEIAKLEGANEAPNVIVVTPADYWNMVVSEKSTGAGYGLPGVVTLVNGSMTINGIPVVKANWLAANKYYVGDFSELKKVVTEGLSLEFSSEDSTNFRDNNITARIEAQVALAIHRPASIIYGDFTAV